MLAYALILRPELTYGTAFAVNLCSEQELVAAFGFMIAHFMSQLVIVNVVTHL